MGNILESELSGTNPLFGAIRTGNLALIKRLLHEGAESIKDTDADGKTAVIYAAFTGHLDIVKWMITEGGARTDEIDNAGMTCLLGAALNGKLDVVKWLLNEGYSDISERNVDEMTCLLNAAWYGRLNIVQWLIEENVESVLEKTTSEGKTALHLAAEEGPSDNWNVRYHFGFFYQINMLHHVAKSSAKTSINSCIRGFAACIQFATSHSIAQRVSIPPCGKGERKALLEARLGEG